MKKKHALLLSEYCFRNSFAVEDLIAKSVPRYTSCKPRISIHIHFKKDHGLKIVVNTLKLNKESFGKVKM